MRANKLARPRARARQNAAVYMMVATIASALIWTLASGTPLSAHVTLDLRSLALGRALLGLVVLADVALSRWPDLPAWYTDDGIWTRRRVIDGFDPQIKSHDISPYLSVGSAAGMRVMFALVGAAAVALIVGYRTNAAAFVCWAHGHCLFMRNSACNNAGDRLTQLLLWWLIFLPCGEAWSIDSYCYSSSLAGHLSSPSPPHNDSASGVASLATAGIMIQLSLVYQFTSMFKVDARWTEGQAIHFVLNNFAFAREPLSTLVLWVPHAPKLLTLATLVVETACPLFLFVAPLRVIASIVFVAFHGGLFATMRLGFFPVACIAGWLMMLPGWCWTAGAGAGAAGAGTAAVPSAAAAPFSAISTATGRSFSNSWDLIHLAALVLQLASICFAVACNLNTLPPTTDWPGRLLRLDLPAGCFEVARWLGQNQQWFLFDKPHERSFWFSIVGKLDSGELVDLHRIYHHVSRAKAASATRRWVDGILHSGRAMASAATTADPMKPDVAAVKDLSLARSRVDAIYKPPERPEDRCWSSSFGNHRWRKLYQKLAEKQKRYAAFHGPLAEHHGAVYEEWNAAAPGPRMGALVSVKCLMHVCRIIPPGDEPDPVGTWEQWPPTSGVAWSVDL